MKEFVTPPSIERGDRIALVTPATVVKEEFVTAAEALIRERGYEPVRMPNFCCGSDGRFANTADRRLEDLLTAFSDKDIKAIWCGRGGYGSVQLISRIPASLIQMNPKWMVGFSDVCALHSMMLKAGVISLHAPMLRRLATHGNDFINNRIFEILEGGVVQETESDIHPLQQCGRAEGRLIGGNVSVLGDLAATPFDPFVNISGEPYILLLEDVGESLSRLQRRLWRLRLAGVFNKAAAIVVGQFTACPGGVNFSTAEEMIADLLRSWNISCPVAYNFPAGHDECNYPLMIGARTELIVDPAYCLLRTL